MVNLNLEMVSIDYDMSDILFFELFIMEDVFNICDCVKFDGVIV